MLSNASNVELMSTHEFHSLCLDQDVELTPEFWEPVELGDYKTTATYTPTVMLGAIAHAGRLLRKEPGKPLADTPISDLTPFGSDFAASTLATIVNTSIEPADNAHSRSYHHPDWIDIGTCPEAEVWFALTIDGLSHYNGRVINYGGDIVREPTGQALFLRKSTNINSALALAPFVSNGVAYPAGSIAEVILNIDPHVKHNNKQIARPEAIKYQVRPVEVEEVEHVIFKRLSAFALPVHEREVFDHELITHESKLVRDTVMRLPIQTAASLATRACVISDEKAYRG